MQKNVDSCALNGTLTPTALCGSVSTNNPRLNFITLAVMVHRTSLIVEKLEAGTVRNRIYLAIRKSDTEKRDDGMPICQAVSRFSKIV